MGKDKIKITVGCVFIAVGVWMFFYSTLAVFGAVMMVVGLALIYFGLGKRIRVFSFKRKKASPPKK